MKVAGLEFELQPSKDGEKTWRCSGCGAQYTFTLFNIAQMTEEVAAHACVKETQHDRMPPLRRPEEGSRAPERR